MKKCGRSETRSRSTRKQSSRTSWTRSIILVAFIIPLAAAFLCAPWSFAAQAPYPSKPISIIVPWAPGSGVDLVPRVMAPHLSKRLGVPVNIVNKPGGSGVPGTLDAVSAAPDGYTMLADMSGTSSIPDAWMKNLPYKVEERTYVAMAVAQPVAFYVRGDAPWKSLQDVEQAIRKDPASFRWGAVGTTHSDFGLRLLKAAFTKRGADVSKTKTVAFQSGAPATTALAGGHIDIYFGSRSLSQPYVDAGKARWIAVTSDERSDVFPGLPTATEQGYPVVAEVWIGFTGPGGLPPNVVRTWESHVKEIIFDPALAPDWKKLGAQPKFMASEQFKKFVLDEAKEVKALTGQ